MGDAAIDSVSYICPVPKVTGTAIDLVHQETSATLPPYQFAHHLLENWSTLFGCGGSFLVPGADVQPVPVGVFAD